jgi:hypothetical protein
MARNVSRMLSRATLDRADSLFSLDYSHIGRWHDANNTLPRANVQADILKILDIIDPCPAPKSDNRSAYDIFMAQSFRG